MGGRAAAAMAIAVWSGMLLAPSGAWLWALLAMAFGWLVWRAPDRVGTVALLIAAFAAGAARSETARTVTRGDEAAIERAGPFVWCAATVDGPPARAGIVPRAVLRVDATRPPVHAGSRVSVTLPDDSAVEWGDRIECFARLEPLPGRRNPGGYDARAARAAHGVSAGGRVLAVTRHDSTGWHAWPRATTARWRRGIEAVLERRLGPLARAYVRPLVVGDRTGTPTELRGDLRAAGLVHLLALSGLHVTWLASVARFAVSVAGGGVTARALAGALCAILYVGIAGPLPSLVRAAVMELLLSLARITNRALDPVQALALTVLAVLAVQPGWAGDVAFQLSCAATLGLVTIGVRIRETLGSWGTMAAPLTATASAQLAAAPILMARMHVLSWSVWASNLLAVPVVGLLLAAAWGAVLLELAAPGAGALLFGACELLSRALHAVAGVASRLPVALLPAGRDAAPVICAAAGAACLIAVSVRRADVERQRTPGTLRTFARLAGVAAAAVATWFALTVAPLRPAPGRAWVVVLDVGQGDAIALGLPGGWWVVDAGMRTPWFDCGQSIVGPFLHWSGVRRLETLVVTHADADHAGGAPFLVRTFAPRRYVDERTVAAGDTLLRAPGVRVLWPPAGDRPANSNAGSLVLELDAGGTRALLAADVDSTVESRLAVRPSALLKVAHHGSGSSSGSAFLARSAPHEAVISCGRRNRFGHPDAGALERLRAFGARVRRTDLDGAVWYELSRNGLRRVDWRRGEPRRRTTHVEPARALAGPRP